MTSPRLRVPLDPPKVVNLDGIPIGIPIGAAIAKVEAPAPPAGPIAAAPATPGAAIAPRNPAPGVEALIAPTAALPRANRAARPVVGDVAAAEAALVHPLIPLATPRVHRLPTAHVLKIVLKVDLKIGLKIDLKIGLPNARVATRD